MAETAVERTPRIRTLWRRWPTALAVTVAVLTLSGDDTEQAVAEILPLLALEYLIVAKLGRRRATWPIIGAMFVLTFILFLQDAIPPSSVFAGLAAIVLAWSIADRQLFRTGELQVQALSMIGFSTVALVGLTVDADNARYIIAAGWLAHGIWDLVYLLRDKVVARSYAEWCGVLDVLVAFGLVFLL